jgi:hypothetical protein
MARFDVVLPVKNGAAYLAAALHSVQAQTERDWRLLVLDHGSTDDTPEIVAQRAQHDARIQHHHLPEAVGLAGLLNAGLALVQAPYALRMDADDICLPGRMAATWRGFEAHPEVAVLGAQARWMDAEGRVGGPMNVPCGRDAVARQALFLNPFIHPAMALRTEAIHTLGLRYGQSLQAQEGGGIHMPSLAEDYLLFGELAVRGLAANLPDTVLHYRHHAGGVSRQKFQDQLAASARVARHLAAQVSRSAARTAFDPVPFGSHGETLLTVGASTDYRAAHADMAATLAHAGPAWAGPEGQRELAWRRVYQDRQPLGLLARAALAAPCRPSRHEWRTVRNAVKQRLAGRPGVRVDALALEGLGA